MWKVIIGLPALALKYRWLSLSRITAYLEVKFLSLAKYENLTTGKKTIVEKTLSCFPQYFQYIS